MINNRAVPVFGVLPELYYQDADGAVRWLCDVFGFEVHYVVPEEDGSVHTAQLQLGNAYVMVRGEKEQSQSPATSGVHTQSLMVVVTDVEAHHRHSTSRGANLVVDLTDQAYGEREYKVLDHEGHVWVFSQHIADVDPLAMFNEDGTPSQLDE
jgi:uncharacterized glyoxalase superfamily protein PhnB